MHHWPSMLEGWDICGVPAGCGASSSYRAGHTSFVTVAEAPMRGSSPAPPTAAARRPPVALALATFESQTPSGGTAEPPLPASAETGVPRQQRPPEAGVSRGRRSSLLAMRGELGRECSP